jgi:hypothetical protein
MRLRSRVGGKYAAGAPRTAILVVIASNLPLTGRFPVALADDFSYYSPKEKYGEFIRYLYENMHSWEGFVRYAPK